jgi:hypothetical protein
MKLTGTKRDGSTFTVAVTARTSRVRLYKEKDVATLDMKGISAATALAIFESKPDEIVWKNLGELASCAALTDLSLGADAATDLGVLGACKGLKHIHLTIFNAKSVDVSWMAKLPALESISLSLEGTHPPVDAAQIPAVVAGVSLLGWGNVELAFTAPRESINATECKSLEKLTVVDASKLEYLHVMDCPKLTSLSVTNARVLKTVHLTDLTSLETIDLASVACPTLERLTLVRHGAGYVDVTPLAACASLKYLDIDGKDAPFLSASADVKSPALREMKRAGRVTTE